MNFFSLRASRIFLPLLGFIFLLNACSTPEERHSAKISLIAHTGSAEKKSQTLASSLERAEQALHTGLKTQEQRDAYHRAIEDVVSLWSQAKTPSQQGFPRELLAQNATSTFQLQAKIPEKLLFDELILARSVKNHELHHDYDHKGIGVAYIARWKSTPERAKKHPFMTRKGYFNTITITLDFKKQASGKKVAILTLHNPNKTTHVTLNHHKYPLEYNQSATIEYILGLKSQFSSIGAVLNPTKYLQYIDLKTISQPDPNRVPVIFVHGLASEPKTWQNVYNELRLDPTIRNKYQIYFFRYPSGVPVLYSAAKLREKLSLLYKELNKNGYHRSTNQMLLIGHSMGGLVTKSQVQDSGDKLWLNFKDQKRQIFKFNDKQLNDIKKYLTFKPNPHISRVIFIATPHRGSGLADIWIVRQLKKLIKAPVAMITAPLSATKNNTNRDALDKLYQSGIPTSMDNLSPQSKYVKTTSQLPIKKDLIIHSIVGNLKGLKLSDPNCSDGVVPYSSAHLNQVKSELVVPYGHSAHEHPEAIREIKRIMLLHLKEMK